MNQCVETKERGKHAKVCAIIVAAGVGSRMKADCPKQYLQVLGKPILYYTLKAFDESEVDDIYVVVSKEYEEYVRDEIISRYGVKKVKGIINGGKERYESVYEGIKAAEGVDYVLVHDGARPFIRPTLINEVIRQVKQKQSVIVGVRAKDTVKIASEDLCVESTPNRANVWNIQTPQAFTYEILKSAYDILMAREQAGITDDAMVVEKALGIPIHIVEGEYSNIKVTTPEDLAIAEIFLH